jgi:hypothetical protein
MINARSIGAWMLFGLLTFAGCSTTTPPLDPATQRQVDEDVEHYQEVRIVNAVKRWYGSPHARVVIESRSPARWLLSVGPESSATSVEVDATTLEIVRVWPGF